MNKKIAKAKKKVNGAAEPEFHQYENFTVCILDFKGKRLVGVAKRNCNCDKPNPERAKTIAYERALLGKSVRL